MNDISMKMKLPSTVRLTLLMLVIAFLYCLSGCASQKTVTCIPYEELSEPIIPQLVQNEDLVQDEDITEALREYFTSWQGTRYRYGGLSRKGVDCSGFTLLTYREFFKKSLPRTVREQVEEGTKISKASLQAGDLVFFKTGIYQKHVGIYLEDDFFIHASRSNGVMISSLSNRYWQKRFWQAQRL